MIIIHNLGQFNNLTNSDELMGQRYLLGIDIGSSSVKTALLDIDSGKPVAVAQSPSVEMPISSPLPGFAEQDPEMWWSEMLNAYNKLRRKIDFGKDEIAAIGISYQMHGLVCLDKNFQPLRSSIIWCDSRAVEIGEMALEKLGEEYCLQHFLNSPGNFTASKLAWVKEHEPALFEQIRTVMLPGDYIALKLTGNPATTISGLSEGIFWDFKENSIANEVLEVLGLEKEHLASIVPSFGEQGSLRQEVAAILDLRAGIPVSYRAGDQPNNAYSLNVLEPGEIAATAGTSGVVYGVTDKVIYDKHSRVNSFVHVNNAHNHPRYGVLMCLNGTGILNSWARKNIFHGMDYEQINQLTASAPIGSEGIRCYPFGNGAERILRNMNPGAGIEGLNFNLHGQSHLARAIQEGIVFALNYGIEIMKEMGMEITKVRAGHANMFLSDVFGEIFCNTTGCQVELYNTDGAVGAARAAGVGAGVFKNYKESFHGLEVIHSIDPDKEKMEAYGHAYTKWKEFMTT